MRVQATGKYIPPQAKPIRLKPNAKRLPKGANGFVMVDVEDPYVIQKSGPKQGAQSGSKSISTDGKEKSTPTLRVVRRTSDNPLLFLLTCGNITDAQFLAGQKYMGAHLICTGQTGQGIDYSRQRVDCSDAPMSLTEKQLNAQDIIRHANRELKTCGQNLRDANEAILRMQKIAGEGLSVTQYCHSIRGFTSSKSIKRQLGNLREDLSVLAKHWGFEGR